MPEVIERIQGDRGGHGKGWQYLTYRTHCKQQTIGYQGTNGHYVRIGPIVGWLIRVFRRHGISMMTEQRTSHWSC